jgi:NAD-dependent SIR2 family protein deacetylase
LRWLSTKQPVVEKKSEEHNPKDCQIPGCKKCKLKKPFELPSEIVDACKVGNLIVFAGAGVSTESVSVYKHTFYQEIKDELKIPKEKQISFSKLMSLYCAPPSGRKDLLQAIKKRIDYVKSFPELYNAATEFHQELSMIPHLDEIFTTNWDDFFERECAATPIVAGQDFAVLHDVPGRKVFKLHGSIYSYGSIVATEEDYRKCYRRLSTGVIGAELKIILMSKTLVFLGFSFDDEDFKRLYRLLSKDVAGLMPRSYVVTLDERAKEKLDELGINAIPIITSAGFFVKKLKEKLVQVKFMLPDQQYEGINEIFDKVLKEHEKISSIKVFEHPDSLYSQWYQDGLQHAFTRLLATKSSGENSCGCHMVKLIESYEALVKDCLRAGNYPDAAYFTGYQAGLICFLSDDRGRRSMPMYFLFRCGDIRDFDQYITMEKEAAKLHKSAHEVAVALASRLKSKNLVLHRRPF